MVNLEITNKMGKVFITMLMATSMMAIGNTTREMEEVWSIIMMVASMMDN